MADADFTTERWLPVPGYEGRYDVSDMGRVKSLARSGIRSDGRRFNVQERVLAPPIHKVGYPIVMLWRNNKSKTLYVHRLVLEAFVGPCPDGMECCHHNDDPLDNRLSNLRWDDRKGNMSDMIRLGGHSEQKKTTCIRGHLLAGLNLREGKRYRECLSCARARGYLRTHSLEHMIQEVSDSYYRAIMSGTWVDGRRAKRAA